MWILTRNCDVQFSTERFESILDPRDLDDTTRRQKHERQISGCRSGALEDLDDVHAKLQSCSMRVCGFCGGEGINKEHVWPDWMRKVILESRAAGGMKGFHAEIERGGKTSQFKNPTLEIQVGMPCDTCNRSWMSNLETKASPFMTGMVYRGEKTLLDEERQRTLVRWIVKTAMVYEFTAASTEAKYFSQAERLAFKDRLEIPQNLWIWLARYDGIRPMHAVQRRAPKSSDIPPRIYSLTFSANLFAIQVFAFRESEGDLGQVARATRPERLLQLWPAPGAWMTWPPDITIDDDALAVLDDRYVNLLKERGAPPKV